MAFNMELMVRLKDLVPSNHTYRKLKKYWDFSQIERTLDQKEYYSSHKGFGMFKLFKCLLIQFMENLSDRELEEYIQGNTNAKWFCDFNLTDKTSILWCLKLDNV